VVALSTTEAEYITVSDAIKEAMWLKDLVSELLGVEVKATLMCDSQSAIHLSKNQAYLERTKHIGVRHHFIRNIVEDKTVFLTKIAGEDNATDMFTKPMPSSKLKHYMGILQVIQEEIEEVQGSRRWCKAEMKMKSNQVQMGGEFVISFVLD